MISLEPTRRVVFKGDLIAGAQQIEKLRSRIEIMGDIAVIP